MAGYYDQLYIMLNHPTKVNRSMTSRELYSQSKAGLMNERTDILYAGHKNLKCTNDPINILFKMFCITLCCTILMNVLKNNNKKL
jgi:hypothetical protein